MKQNLAKLVTKDSVLQALQKIEIEKPNLEDSTKYDLEYNGNYYPPKEVVREAARIMGIEIDDELHTLGGGDKTNIPLSELGFVIVNKNQLPAIDLNKLTPQVNSYNKAINNTDWLKVNEIYKFNFVNWVIENIDFKNDSIQSIKDKIDLSQEQKFEPNSNIKGINFLTSIKRYNDEFITLDDISLLKSISNNEAKFNESIGSLSFGSYPKVSLYLSLFIPEEYCPYDGESLPAYDILKVDEIPAPKKGYKAFKFYQTFYKYIREFLKNSEIDTELFKTIFNTDELEDIHWNWITQDFLLYISRNITNTNSIQKKYDFFIENESPETWDWYLNIKKYSEAIIHLKDKLSKKEILNYSELNKEFKLLVEDEHEDFLNRYLFMSNNGFSTIRQQLIKNHERKIIFDKVNTDFRLLESILLNGNKEQCFNLVHKLIGGNYWSVIYRFVRALFPNDFTAVDAPNHFSGLIQKLYDDFEINLSETNQIGRSKEILNLIKYDDEYKAQIFFWMYKEESQNNENEENQMANLNIPLNQILFGAPGTGKTYTTKKLAVEIIDGISYDDKDRNVITDRYEKLFKAEQINFTTFHQSISYEDFVEGIKPVLKTDDENDEDDEKEKKESSIEYEIKNGIFKRMCQLAEGVTTKVEVVENIDFQNKDFYKMSLGGKHRLEKHNWSIKNDLIFLGWGGDKDFTELNKIKDWKSFRDKFKKDFPDLVKETKYVIQAVYIFQKMKIGDIVVISKGNKIIDAIGIIESEYFYDDTKEIDNYQFRKVKWLATNMNSSTDIFVRKEISQQTIYQFYNDDVKIEAFNENFKKETKIEEPKKYVLVIDEINRGNVSSIFGELITLLEKDKRKGVLKPNKETLVVDLPYSNDKFSVPDNLYIIGTMNTADRSVEALDTALRRRFSFVEMLSKPDLLLKEHISKGLITDSEGKEINLISILTSINERIELLIDKDHQIGHSFLINTNSFDELKFVFKDSIIPLLEEYFFGDFGKIGLVIGGEFIKHKDTKTKFPSNFKYGEDNDISNFTDKIVYEFTSFDNWTAKTFTSIYE